MIGTKFKNGSRDPDHAHYGGGVIPRLALDIFYLHTKLSDSSFSRSGDMIAGVEIENESCNPDHATFCYGFSLSSKS